MDAELLHIKGVLERNGYRWRQSCRIANSSGNTRRISVERAVAYLPFVKGVTDKIGHLLKRRYSIKTIFRPLTQVRQFLRSPKDRDPLGVPGVYSIPCDCGKCYVGETKRNVSTRLTEHIRAMKNVDINSSALAEHSLTSGTSHYIRFDKARVLSREKFFVPRKIREAIEISRLPNFNRDRGWALPQAWKSCLYGTYDSEVIEPDRDTVSVACLAAPGTPDGCDGSGSDDDGAPQPDRNDVIEERVMTRTHALPPPPRRTSREERAQRRSARRDAEGV